MVQNRGSGGHHTVLIAILPPAVVIPPHHIALRRLAQIGPSDSVKVVHLPLSQVGIGVFTAAGMDEERVMAHRQFNVIGTGGTDGADHPHILHRLKYPQHPGDTAFGHHLIDDISLRLPQLRQGLLQVV